MSKACLKCKNIIPNRVKIDGKIRILNKRKYCLDCSPFLKHNTIKLDKIKEVENKVCPKCRVTKPIDDFYSKREKMGSSSYCKKCCGLESAARQRKIKQQCVDYLGSKCALCAYDRCLAALEFHHIDMSTKEFSIGYVKTVRFEKLKRELDKCILLCAICHREVHAGLLTIDGALDRTRTYI